MKDYRYQAGDLFLMNDISVYKKYFKEIHNFYKNIQQSGPRSTNDYICHINELNLYDANKSIDILNNNPMLNQSNKEENKAFIEFNHIKPNYLNGPVPLTRHIDINKVTDSLFREINTTKKSYKEDNTNHSYNIWLDDIQICYFNVQKDMYKNTLGFNKITFKQWVSMHHKWIKSNFEGLTAVFLIVLQIYQGGVINVLIIGII